MRACSLKIPAMMSDELVAQILNLSQTRSTESPCVSKTVCARCNPLKKCMKISKKVVMRRVVFLECLFLEENLFYALVGDVGGLYRDVIKL